MGAWKERVDGKPETNHEAFSCSTDYDIITTENKDNDSQMNLQNGVGPILIRTLCVGGCPLDFQFYLFQLSFLFFDSRH